MVWHDDVNQVYAKLIVPTRAPLQASMATEAGLAKTARLVACVKPVRTLIHHLWFAATMLLLYRKSTARVLVHQHGG